MSVKEEFNMSANAGDELKQEQQDNGQMYDNQNYNDQDSQNNDNNSQENGGGGDQTGDNNSQNNEDQNYTNDQNNSQMDDQNSQNNDENNRGGGGGAGGNSMEPEQFRKVFIGGLSYKTDDDTLKSYFSKYGELVDFVVMKDGQSGRSRGFGFVTYSCSSMVDELMKNRPHIIDGRQVEPKRATPREDSGKTEVQMTVKKLFIGGLRDNVTDEDLKTYFGNYGNVVEAIMMKDKETNKSRGFGFVTFDDYDPVDKIILEKHHTINGVNVHTQKALPKDFERNQNNNNNNNFNNRGGNQSGGGFNNGGNFRNNNNNGNGFGNNFNNGNGGGGGASFGNFGMGGFHVGNRNNQFQSNGSLSNTYGSYNQAPNNPKMNSDGNRNNNNNNKMGGGPMKGGQGRFTNRSNGPYGGKNNGGGFNNGGNNFNNNFNNNRPGRGRGIGQRGGGGGGQGNMNNDNQNMNN